MAYWYPSVLTYKQYAQANTFVEDITGSIENQTERIESVVSEHTSAINTQTKNIIASNYQIKSAIESGFQRIAEINRNGFEQVSSVIEVLNSDLNYNFGVLIQKIEYQNSLLNNILETIQAPFETKVREYFNKGCELASGGLFNEAIEFFKHSFDLPTGNIFFPSYYQLGRLYLTGVNNETNVVDPIKANEYLLFANKYGTGILKASGDNFTVTPVVGQTYSVKVISTHEYGADVEFSKGGTISLLHISEISNSNTLKMGERIQIKVIEKTDRGYFKVSQKAAQNEAATNSFISSHPFSPILADCKFFLSQSYYYQLTGNKNSTDKQEKILQAIKYCNEATVLNPKHSQGFYFLSKYYAYENDIGNLKLNLAKAILLDRTYLIHVHNDEVFKPFINELTKLFEELRVKLLERVEPALLKAAEHISDIELKSVENFKPLVIEFQQLKSEFETAKNEFQTKTYFGIDNCRIKMQNFMSNKLENLANKLDNELNLIEEAKKKDEGNKSYAESEGTKAAFGGAIKGALVGFVLAAIVGIWSNLGGGIVFVLSIAWGGYIHYVEAYQDKRKY